MTKAEFAARWSAAERRSNSPIWTVFFCAQLALGLGFVAGILMLCAAPFISFVPGKGRAFVLESLQLLAGSALLFTVVVYLQGRLGPVWLTKIGMQCPKCGHFLNSHTGERLRPHVEGKCADCESNLKCRQVINTGVCDKCGHRIFDV